ncbi:sensor histidine kinase [Paenibacillus thalictri]|nr:ATP-binding protein [Paenibacillus thalictri]
MIKETRRKLVFIYSGIIGLILVIMAISFYLILSGIIHRDEHYRIDIAGKRAAEEWQRRNSRMDGENKHPLQKVKMEWEYLQGDQFALIEDPQENVGVLSPGTRNPFKDETIRKQLRGENKGRDYFYLDKTDGEANQTYVVSHIADVNNSGNALYIAEEVSSQVRLLSEMRWLLAGFTLVLLAVASATGYVLAGRAMVPITRYFKRQQEFTADASHELRTPLSILQASAEILEEQKQQLPPLHQKVLQHMKEEIVRMIRLTEQLLALARSDSHPPHSGYAVSSLRQIIRTIVERMKIPASKKNITIAMIGPAADSLKFFGDADQMNQLLYILLDNAIKYSSAGEKIMVQTFRSEAGDMVIKVTDHGIGIPAEDIPNLFERFYRVDKARSRELGGTGLGLSIAYRIVEMHGGKISVTSEPGKGSTFEIVLPESSIKKENNHDQ